MSNVRIKKKSLREVMNRILNYYSQILNLNLSLEIWF